MKSIVGHCVKCGAPIYAPSIWHGITPPPSEFSCGCNPQPTYTDKTTLTLTTCNGEINIGNGRCVKCGQVSQVSAGRCIRLIES